MSYWSKPKTKEDAIKRKRGTLAVALVYCGIYPNFFLPKRTMPVLNTSSESIERAALDQYIQLQKSDVIRNFIITIALLAIVYVFFMWRERKIRQSFPDNSSLQAN